MSSPPQRPSVTARVRDRDLVRLYWPVELRPAFDALFAIDDAMGDVVVRSTQPALGAIKLAWWRERLEELDQGKVPAEPRLQSVANELLPRGIEGADLAGIESGWAELLAERPDPENVLERGVKLFALAARLLGTSSAALPSAGRLFVAGSLQQRSLGVPGAFVVTDLPRFSRRLRPLTALAALAKRDLSREEPEGAPGRAWTLLKHRLTGRI
jgi:15-cis-phytoene synthase